MKLNKIDEFETVRILFLSESRFLVVQKISYRGKVT